MEKRATLDKESALAKTLSDHLKAHELIAWIQEEALARLAEGGSRHLAKLSQNRYALRLGSGPEVTAARAEQDFFVVDAWNGDSIRSVRTLSGGETFLASLALALALAESLTELGAESRATDALESLFLDEGFGTLDSDTLDVVVGALDALHGGDRMVGIVTHVRELAERLPARLEVGARVSSRPRWSCDRLMGRRSGLVAWALALAAGVAALAALGYGSRDADSRLYAEMAARMSAAPAAGWIAPDFPPGWYMSGLFREHPAGLFVPAAALARLGYPAPQAAYALNAVYQVLTIVLLQRLAAALVPGLEARALGWLVQLLPIAFTFRIRANHEPAVLLCLVAALYGTERARSRPRWALLTVAGLVGLLLVKGVLAVFGPALCALWLLCSPPHRPRAGALGARGLARPRGGRRGDGRDGRRLRESCTGRPRGSPSGPSTSLASSGWPRRRASGAAFSRRRETSSGTWAASPGSRFPGAWRCSWPPGTPAGSRPGSLPPGTRPRRGAPSPAACSRSRASSCTWASSASRTAAPTATSSPSTTRWAPREEWPPCGPRAACAASPATLDRPWVPAAVWAVTFTAHLFAGRLGLPTVKLWAPGP